MNNNIVGDMDPNPFSTRRVEGNEVRALIETQLALHSQGIISVLSQYQLPHAIKALHGTIQAIEEFINIPLFEIEDPGLSERLLTILIDDRFISNPEPAWQIVKQILSPHFEPAVVRRYLLTMLQIGSIASSFRMHGQTSFGDGIALDRVGGAVKYFQSRRRHLVSLLYTMPYACRGQKILTSLDTLNVLLPQIEQSCISITSFHQQLILLETLDNFSLEVGETGAMASHSFETLEGLYLEPERASIHAMAELRPDQFIQPKLENIDPKKIFSASELRNAVKLIQAAYATFGLNDSDFSTMAQLIIAFSRQCRDDYFIEIPKTKFRVMLLAQTRLNPDELELLLVNVPSNYARNTNAFEPFINLGDMVVSNVNLLMRFLYVFKNVHLGSRRRFQIHSGFIFEDMIKRDLETIGFHVTDIKRINRKEFDVVTTHCGVIYNFQCKNNWIDLAKVENDRKLFVRYNRSRVNYYRRALAKEEKREHLLKGALGLDKIEHYVISRFPVICTDPRIISYNQIDLRLKPLIRRMPTEDILRENQAET
ncbi:hypothetical protein F3F96_02360 [Mariprofundus sp. NF]|uniref:hypothetical protein n=1 Tax=Mariprofundus sp. NF TaxID=2608716 RepID=UPI0015A05EF2|nr:hypothetical protein [Mariprofundus sp. NF]NWF37982.1 hypothetical protein [Mariprofundus sp. NF]